MKEGLAAQSAAEAMARKKQQMMAQFQAQEALRNKYMGAEEAIEEDLHSGTDFYPYIVKEVTKEAGPMHADLDNVQMVRKRLAEMNAYQQPQQVPYYDIGYDYQGSDALLMADPNGRKVIVPAEVASKYKESPVAVTDQYTAEQIQNMPGYKPEYEEFFKAK